MRSPVAVYSGALSAPQSDTDKSTISEDRVGIDVFLMKLSCPSRSDPSSEQPRF